jgi:SAM-dependent methyltransferase
MKKYYEAYDARYRKAYSAGMKLWHCDYDSATQTNNGIKKVISDIIQSGSIPKPPAKLIDIGCGEGLWSMAWAQKGYDVSGIDISEAAIEKAMQLTLKKKLSINFFCDDVMELKTVMDESFDLAFESYCFQHIIYDRDRKRCFRRISRILKPEAFLIVNYAWDENGLAAGVNTPQELEELRSIERSSFLNTDSGRLFKRYKHETDGSLRKFVFEPLSVLMKNREAAIREFEDAGFVLKHVFDDSSRAIFKKIN